MKHELDCLKAICNGSTVTILRRDREIQSLQNDPLMTKNTHTKQILKVHDGKTRRYNEFNLKVSAATKKYGITSLSM